MADSDSSLVLSWKAMYSNMIYVRHGTVLGIMLNKDDADHSGSGYKVHNFLRCDSVGEAS